jgi:mono/diheme cytochrome c family protein
MRRPAALLAAVLAATTACARGSGAAAAAPQAAPTPPEVTAQAITLGDSLFNNGSCQRCHGAKGVGGQNGPSLVAGPWLHVTGTDFAAIAALITSGVPREQLKDANRRPMNPRGGPMQLSDERVRAVAAYVWSISRTKG